MNIRPKLNLLGPEQINEVHNYSIRILEDTGIKVESKTALEIFAKSDGVKIKDDVVYIKGELIEHAIKQAPSNIEVFNKNGDSAFHLGKNQGNETHFGIGCTNTWFQDIVSGEVELFTRKHMQHSTKLGDLLDNYAMVSTLGIPSDVAVEKVDLFSALDMYANTTKPLVLLISGKGAINEVFDLILILHGDISALPFCIPYVNPITPLVLNETTTDKMIASINHDLPFMYSNYSMYGDCAPFGGGNFDSMAFSPATVVLSNQIISEARKFAKGFALNDETVNLHEIDNVGHGGDYLTSEQTLANLHELSNTNAIWSSLSLDAWKEQHMPTADKELIQYTQELYSRAILASEENIDIIKKGEEYIESH